ncbi:hypothetical protein E2C01_054236 [Portunus trituberculatus]|uniref:Uncharacterized protein n=1 Tax=Portunus trituberculatus TaxID=210409 RepID=A0A5B7GT70_PORTR|nr:hypothetical protein [Portunus trituberculatus]
MASEGHHQVQAVIRWLHAKGSGGVVDKVVRVGSGRRPRIGSNPTTYRFDAMPFVEFIPALALSTAVAITTTTTIITTIQLPSPTSSPQP